MGKIIRFNVPAVDSSFTGMYADDTYRLCWANSCVELENTLINFANESCLFCGNIDLMVNASKTELVHFSLGTKVPSLYSL